ncbi:MAG: GDP-mannose 4,6-dehydratase [Sulfolobales archaeon]|nr:GDP-mannose 4,6-dehydratase [Sulfolobales archaeon]MCX8185864.1 GDP-mannose 4,6-dehydratase [Sulfolobales archaeon]MDW7969121.1 GDP-mannose 4,6-dehydratase [Sulfolobales archaeon]
MEALVTGGAGFIGSYVVEELVKRGLNVRVIDNLSSGNYEYIKGFVEKRVIEFYNVDLKTFNDKLVSIFEGVDVVYHLAANPEVRVSVSEPRTHFNENVLASFNVLEACRLSKVKLLVFTSSSTVYGDAKLIPTPEDYTPLEPISVYGASKLAVENLIITYSKLYGIKGLILRLANIVGGRQTHGVIVDFIKKLRKDGRKLEVLGDGRQKKSYLHITDFIAALNVAIEYLLESSNNYEIFNLGNNDWIEVDEIAKEVVDGLGLKHVELHHLNITSDGRGWVGDVKFMLLAIDKISKLGWKPRLTSRDAIRHTVNDLVKIL